MGLSLAQAVTTGAGGSNGSSSYGSNVTNNNLLVAVFTGSGSAITVSGITDTRGSTWHTLPGSTTHVTILWAVAGSSGANTITATGTGTSEGPFLYEWKGFLGTPTLDKTTTASGTSGNPTAGPLTTTGAPEVLHAAFFFSGTATGGGTGWTATVTGAGNLWEYIVETSSGSFTATSTPTDTGWDGVFATFKGSASPIRAKLMPLGI